jgi:hypothetical protein
MQDFRGKRWFGLAPVAMTLAAAVACSTEKFADPATNTCADEQATTEQTGGA